MANDGDHAGTGLPIGLGGKAPAEHDRRTDDGVIVAADVLPGHALGSVGRADTEGAPSKRRDAAERRRGPITLVERVVGRQFELGSWIVAEEKQTFRLMHGHGPEQDGIHQREDRGVAADPDGERGNGRDRKAARTTERADGVANIAPDIFEPGQRALIALPLDRLRQAAGANARRARRLVRRKAATAFIGSRELDVQPQLLVEIGVGADAGDGGPQPRQPLAHRRRGS